MTVGEFKKFVEATGYVTEPEQDEEGGGGFDEKLDEFRRGKEFTWRNVGWQQTDLHPVLNVTWNDAIAFCKWLSDKDQKEYRLPTEAEWEYACRGGTRTRYQNGNDPEELPAVANISDSSMKERFPRSNNTIAAKDGFALTAPVGKFRPNRFGLHDMHGNVLEWCADWYRDDYYRDSPTENPPGPASGPGRVIRGGAYGVNASRCRSAEREWYVPVYRGDYLGFRVALSIEP